MVDEIATLLTAGRLNPENRAIVEAAYSQKLTTSGEKEARKIALQLVATTAEFHVTNQVVTKSGGDRAAEQRLAGEAPSDTPPLDYKAVIFLNLSNTVHT